MSVEFSVRLVGMAIFALLGAILGVDSSDALNLPSEATGLTFSLMGALVGLIMAPWLTIYPARRASRTIARMPAENLFMSMIGLVVGMAASAMLAYPLSLLPDPFGQFLPTILAIVVTYIGITLFALRGQDVFALFDGVFSGSGHAIRTAGGASGAGQILLDTSVIIDGRILDISRTGFIQSEMLIPRFVLNELQHVADSSDVLRRNRGKRGLEILSELQQASRSPVIIVDEDVDGITEVDEKLVVLGRQRGIPVMTQDFNLNRVAELQGVEVLDIHELYNAVKTNFFAGETIDIHVGMEGREEAQ